MFVKLIQGTSEHIYEGIHVSIDSSECATKNRFMVSIESAYGKVISHIVEKDQPAPVGVYLMNEDGRTIDTIFSKSSD